MAVQGLGPEAGRQGRRGRQVREGHGHTAATLATSGVEGCMFQRLLSLPVLGQD